MDLPLTELIIRAMHVLWTEGVDPLALSGGCGSQTPDLVSPPASPVEESNPAAKQPAKQSISQQCPLFRAKLQTHISRLLSPQTMNTQTIALALMLVSRLRRMNSGDAVRAGSEPHLLSTAFLVALKVLDDWRIDSVAWVSYCQLDINVIHAMEREFLAKIQWNVHVTRSEYIAFLNFMAQLRDGWVLDATVFPIAKHESHYYQQDRKHAVLTSQKKSALKLQLSHTSMPRQKYADPSTTSTVITPVGVVTRRASSAAILQEHSAKTVAVPGSVMLAGSQVPLMTQPLQPDARRVEQHRVAHERYLESLYYASAKEQQQKTRTDMNESRPGDLAVRGYAYPPILEHQKQMSHPIPQAAALPKVAHDTSSKRGGLRKYMSYASLTTNSASKSLF
ncbi:hypothetical protein HDU78_010147 [Chytriomyces hyalinus]|nr:hypothetical protein HDU78_010147 [Chytriomyces hyalinus]